MRCLDCRALRRRAAGLGLILAGTMNGTFDLAIGTEFARAIAVVCFPRTSIAIIKASTRQCRWCTEFLRDEPVLARRRPRCVICRDADNIYLVMTGALRALMAAGHLPFHLHSET